MSARRSGRLLVAAGGKRRPHGCGHDEWRAHYGREWSAILEEFDPNGVLSNGFICFPESHERGGVTTPVGMDT